jgi:hypothetical protein
MDKFGLTWEITWRVVVWGMAGGAVLGAIYGPLSLVLITILDALGLGPDAPDRVPGIISNMPLWLFLGLSVGAMLGGLNGLLVGIVDGLALSIIAAFVLRSRVEGRRYRITLAVTSAAIGGLCAFLFFMWAGPPIPTYEGNVQVGWLQKGLSLEWLRWVLLPALIAAGYGWWLGNRVAQWVGRWRDLHS